jgi:hypothetical protein
VSLTLDDLATGSTMASRTLRLTRSFSQSGIEIETYISDRAIALSPQKLPTSIFILRVFSPIKSRIS